MFSSFNFLFCSVNLFIVSESLSSGKGSGTGSGSFGYIGSGSGSGSGISGGDGSCPYDGLKLTKIITNSMKKNDFFTNISK